MLLHFFQPFLGVPREADVLAADFECLYQFEFGDGGGEDRVDFFNADPLAHLPDRHGLMDTGPAREENHPLEHLDALLDLTLGIGFLDLMVHAHFHPGTHGVRGKGLVLVGFGHSERDIRGD